MSDGRVVPGRAAPGQATPGHAAPGRAIPSLTGIRGVAAVWVVFYHLHDFARFDPRFAPLSQVPLVREGFRGVDLFFILSGFILMHVHRDDFAALRGRAVSRFLLLRAWRVYPLNAAVLVLILGLYLALPGFHDPAALNPAGIVQSFALAQRWFMPDYGSVNGPAWSLSVELLGYAAFPVIAVALNRLGPRAALAAAAGCLALLVAAAVWFGFADHNVTGRVTVVRMFPAFVAGAALAAFYAAVQGAGSPADAGGRLAGACAVACLVLCSVPSHGAPFGSWGVWAPVAMAGLILGLAFERGPINRVMASAPVVWLGRISFSLYLTNLVVIELVVWLLAGRRGGAGPAECAAVTAATLAAVLAVAACVYHLVERPVARLGRRVLRAPGERPAGSERPAPAGVTAGGLYDRGGPVVARSGAARGAG